MINLSGLLKRNKNKDSVQHDIAEKAMALINDQKLDDAETLLKKSIDTKPTSAAWRTLSIVHGLRNDPEQAVTCLEHALEADINDAMSLALMAEALLQNGDIMQAAGHYMLAIQAAPEVLTYKQRFLELAGKMEFAQHNPHFEKTLLACFNTPELDCDSAQTLWLSLLQVHPDFAFIFFGKDKNYAKLETPFFLQGIDRMLIGYTDFENFILRLRRDLLEEPNHTTLTAALAGYVFRTEYILDVTADEQKEVNNLQEKLEQDPSNERLVATYACYAPLHTLKNANDVARLHSKGALAQLVQTQITEWDALRTTAKKIEPLTEIDPGLSSAVQAQYEEFPYPVWRNLQKVSISPEIAPVISKKGARILIAGCGTGFEAAVYAAALPDAEILAIDLSRASLAYAIRKTEALGLKNITFKQADILRLGDIELEPFDFISSSGVLVCLEDPLAGWKILTNLLKPGGMMHIALYSEIARQDVVHGREVIAKGGYTNDREGMLKFRRESTDIVAPQHLDMLHKRLDWYALSTLRDMLFHVKEHRFTLPQIKEYLDTLGLEFVHFIMKDQRLAHYRAQFPHDLHATSLDNWHTYEQENPETFFRMYQFVSRKKPISG